MSETQRGAGPDRLCLVLAALALIIGPLWFPGATAFEHAITPKTMAIAVLVFMVALAAASRPLRGLALSIKPGLVDWGVLLFALAAAVSAVGVISPFRALFGLGFLGIFVAWYLAVSRSVDLDSATRWLLPAMGVAAGLAAIHALLQLFGVDPLGRWLIKPFAICSVFGNPNYLAGFLALALPAVLACIHTHPNRAAKIVFGIIAALEFMAIMATRSRAGLAAAVVVFLFFCLLRLLAKKPDSRPSAVISWAAVVVAVAAWVIINPAAKIGAAPQAVKNQDKMIRTLKTESNRQRLLIWESAVRMGLDNPLTGVGINHFGRLYSPTAVRVARGMDDLDDSELLAGIAEVAHSEHLQVWAEMGIVGLLAWLFLILAAGITGVRAVRWGLANGKVMEAGAPVAGLGAVAILATVDFPLHVAPNALAAWTYLALVATWRPDRTGEAGRLAIKPGVLAGVGLIAAVLGVGLLGIRGAAGQARAELLFHSGKKSLFKNDPDAAMDSISSAIAINPHKPDYYYWRSRAYSAKDVEGLALWDLEQAARLGFVSPSIYNRIGLIWDHAKIWHKAESAFDSGLAMIVRQGQAGHLDLLINVGNLIAARDGWEKSAPWYALAVQAAPEDADAWRLLGAARMKSMQLSQGLDALLHAHDLAPGDPDIMELIGQAYHHMGDAANAMEWYNKAIEADPGFARAYLNLGLLNASMNRLQQTREAYENAIMADPASEAAMEARRMLAPILENSSNQ